MFVRRKKNRSGTTSVVVVDKHGGKFKELHTVGIGRSEDEISVSTDEDKIIADEKWDGLKGYVTNTELDASEVVSQYRGL